MIRVRKQIERLEYLRTIAVFLQLAEITCEGCGIARDIHHGLGTETRHFLNDLRGPTPRWIKDHDIGPRVGAQQLAHARASRHTSETNVGEMSACRIRLGICDRGAILFDANDFSRATGERKTQISCTTIEFNHSLFLLYITQLEQGPDEP